MEDCLEKGRVGGREAMESPGERMRASAAEVGGAHEFEEHLDIRSPGLGEGLAVCV